MTPTVLSVVLAHPGHEQNWTPLILVLVVIAVGIMNANLFVRYLRSARPKMTPRTPAAPKGPSRPNSGFGLGPGSKNAHSI